jgi:hypothetical protein
LNHVESTFFVSRTSLVAHLVGAAERLTRKPATESGRKKGRLPWWKQWKTCVYIYIVRYPVVKLCILLYVYIILIHFIYNRPVVIYINVYKNIYSQRKDMYNCWRSNLSNTHFKNNPTHNSHNHIYISVLIQVESHQLIKMCPCAKTKLCTPSTPTHVSNLWRFGSKWLSQTTITLSTSGYRMCCPAIIRTMI